MITLGIETSCDECSASALRDGLQIVANVVSSQVDLHRSYGGVVPEIAARAHVETVIPVILEALKGTSEKVDLIAVTAGPGLVGSLVVGVSVAKALSYAWGVPMIAVNHVEGHLFSPMIEDVDLEFPFLGVAVSGGHTLLADVRGFDDVRVLGETVDDALGEAYDKISKFYGLGYPGGPVIDRLAAQGDPGAVDFPRPMIKSPDYNFSLSGLKTAVIRYTEKKASAGEEIRLPDVLASFQAAALEVIIEKTRRAARALRRERVCVGGGVACNTALRRMFSEMCELEGIYLSIPSPRLCTDNAAMIAYLGYHLYREGYRCVSDIDVHPGLRPGKEIPGCERTM